MKTSSGILKSATACMLMLLLLTGCDPQTPKVTKSDPTKRTLPTGPSTGSPELVGDGGETTSTEVKSAAEKAAGKPDTTPKTDEPKKDETVKAEETAPEAPKSPEAPKEPEKSKTEVPAKETPAPGDAKITGDWPMWGGTAFRNMVSEATGLNLDFDIKANKNIDWSMKLGTQTYGNPVVSKGKVFVGTNNGAEYRPKHKGDRGVLICFNEPDGKFLWQLTREKLPIGQVQDWPEQGICSSCYVEGDRLWVITNRCEVMCIDTEGFYDGENDGEVQDEVDNEKEDADIVWNYDMINELGVFPHNLATSSPVVHGDLVFLVTSNGVDEAHLELPSPQSPSFIALNKNTGKLVWERNEPGDKVLHGQWSSPALGEVNGETLVFFPGGNGRCYAYKVADGELVWEFDLNPKETKWELGGAGTRNNIIATPVFHNGSIFLGVGQDPEHGEGTGHFYRIDATKKGDISLELGEINQPGTPNPNKAAFWHYGGTDDEKGTITGEASDSIFRRSLSTAAVHGDLVFIADLSGYVHCLDYETGKRHWMHDTKSAIWGSPLYADGKVFIGTEDGRLIVFEATKEKANVIKQFDTVNYSSIYTTPTIANGKMYLTDRTRLYCIPIQKK
jgi:outer membrane protein assembly factor BamB